MVWILTSIPLDLLDAILGLNESIEVLNLWLTGDRLMQNRISRAVTTISFVKRKEFAMTRFPKFIENLVSLRELTIDRGIRDSQPNTLMYHKEAMESLRSLNGSRLKKLVLRFRYSVELLLPTKPSLSHTLSSLDAQWTLNTAFTCLETLEIYQWSPWTRYQLEALPGSLTHLTTTANGIKEEQVTFSSLLPRTLLRLELRNDVVPNAAFFSHLPPQLTYLESSIASSMDSTPEMEATLATLPRTLTHLSPHFRRFSPSCLADLPPLLKVKWDTGKNRPFISDSSLLKPTPPITGLTLRDCIPASLIFHLPDTITELNVSIIGSDVSRDQWPKNLEILGLILDEDFRMTSLPSKDESLEVVSGSALSRSTAGLVSLVIDDDFCLTASDISELPRSLKSLNCQLKAGVLVSTDEEVPLKEVRLDFPPFLTFLEIGSEGQLGILERVGSHHTTDSDGEWMIGAKVVQCFPFESLPATILTLKFNGGLCLPASKVKHLPPRLELLDIAYIFNDADFDPTSESEVTRMKENFQIGNQAGVHEVFDKSLSPVPSIATLLPRTLRSLSVRYGGAAAKAMDWKMIPPNLNALDFRFSKGVSTDAILEMPMNHLESLTLSLDEPKDDHFKALPSSLTSFVLFPHNASLLTPHAAVYLPTCMSHLFSGNPSTQFIDAITIIYSSRLRLADAGDQGDYDLYARLISRKDVSVLQELKR